MVNIPIFLADAGTPLIWAGFLHLTIGNMLIGLLEAWIVRRVFTIRGVWMVFWIIAANYASAIGGMFFLDRWAPSIISWIGGPLSIYAIYRIFLVLAAITFAFTLVIEWPFYWMAVWKQKQRWKLSIWATLLANLSSYGLLVGWYWIVSAKPTQWDVQLTNPDQLRPNSAARILYISPDGSEVMQLRLDGSKPTPFCALSEAAPDATLGFYSGANGLWQLHVKPFEGPSRPVREVRATRAATRPSDYDRNWQTYFSDDLEEPGTEKWAARTGNWPFMGITLDNNLTGGSERIMAVEMPWLWWVSCNATILPNDQLVFQLGEQIMWVDLDRHLVAAVAAGHGPVVVLD